MSINLAGTQTVLRCIKCMTIVTLLSISVGCDPCINNPCNDGVACNGLETCSASGGSFNCSDGTSVVCDAGRSCTEPDGACDGTGCVEDSECDDENSCTADSCDQQTGNCVNAEDCESETCNCDDGDACTQNLCDGGVCSFQPVPCPDGATCDPETGECTVTTTGPATTLTAAAGTYTGSGTCAIDQVELTNDNGTLMLTGFTGNGIDASTMIPLMLTNDVTGTAGSVTAFGNPGHSLDFTLDPTTGLITFDLSVAGTCSTTLTKVPC